MKHMSHPDDPETVVEADEQRAVLLEPAGWTFLKPGPDPKDDKK